MGKAIDFWKMVEEQKQYPCTYCESGWTNISQYIDKDTGRLMQVLESCSETCSILKLYGERKNIE